MSDPYLAIAQVAGSQSMQSRVTACAAQEDAPGDPTQWAWDNRYGWAAAPGWGAAWASSLAGHPDDPSWDPGAQSDVITDGMILTQIQAMLAK